MSLWSVDDISTGVLMQKFYEALAESATKAKAVQTAATAVKRMTAAEAIAFCRQTVQRLEESGNPQAARLLGRDIGELYYQARDYAAARATFEPMMNDTDLPIEELASLDAAITRCDRLEALGGQPDLSTPVFDHPFWWAPFVLIGDCK
jgi:CHAT domain-containing protein